MKLVLTFTAIFFLFNSFSQEDTRTIVSKGDTLEMTKELRKEYTFLETVTGEIFKVEDTKYLIIWNVSKKSKNYRLKIEEPKPYINEQNKQSTPIVAIDTTNYLEDVGLHLETAGKYKNAAIVTTILTTGAGVVTLMLMDDKTGQFAGYAIIGVGQLTSLILNISGNSHIKKAGEIFRKEKLKL